MNKIAEFVKKSRRAAGLTQEEFAIRSGLGLRFVRDLEQGKETVRMDKVNVHPYTIKIPAWLNTVLGFFYGWTCQL